MSITSAVAFASPAAPVTRVDATRDTRDGVPAGAPTSEQFAAIMALLAQNNPKLKADLMKQVPANSVGLLDQLLAGAKVGGDTNSALDAARYGMLTDPGWSATGAKGIAPAGNQSKISAAVLSRIAARTSPSVEELLAVGDKEAALAKAKLDALLNTAGTLEGTKLAAANALAAQLLQSATNPTAPIASSDALDPEFKARLDRVISRMKSEAGLDVTLVETVRSQERQDALFAQGRTTTGNIVTWTQDSAHTRGQAADVMVGGSFNNPIGFALLQKIANEEGLRTLGAIDPGHLELPKDAAGMAAAARAIASANATVTSVSSNGVARIATVAQVAPIGTAAPDPNKPLANVVAPAVTSTRSAGNSESTKSSLQDGTSEKKAGTERELKSSTADNNSAAFGDAARPHSATFIGPREASSPSAPAVDGAQRVQDIDTLRDQTPAKSLSQITLDIDGTNGEKQQITVDLRGNTVATHITTDEASAQRLRSHIGELQGALESRGLEANAVRISSNPRPIDSAEAVKQLSASERDAMRLAGSANSQAGDG
ncbi:MAG: hypothetical protein M3Y64_11900, partial [Gemmatimonadota bacterium]|nr:hypothetical protein [Gemmatimonadota bacterium]